VRARHAEFPAVLLVGRAQAAGLSSSPDLRTCSSAIRGLIDKARVSLLSVNSPDEPSRPLDVRHTGRESAPQPVAHTDARAITSASGRTLGNSSSVQLFAILGMVSIQQNSIIEIASFAIVLMACSAVFATPGGSNAADNCTCPELPPVLSGRAD
jgi:hypothetical protein